MVVGVLEIELHLPQSTSLKEKRMVVKGLIAQLQRRFKVAAAEVEYQDLWQRALIGISYVAQDQHQVSKVLSNALRWGEGVSGGEVVRSELHFFAPGDDE